MMNYATEIINLEAGINYEPTFIRTDKRRPALSPTSLGYYQIGELAQYGNAKGPVFKIEFVDLSNLSTAGYVKIWGIENDDTNAPIYPTSSLFQAPDPGRNGSHESINIYLKKFIFCDINGTEINEEGNYIVIGHKRKTIPVVY